LGSPAYVQNREKAEETDRDLVVRALEGDQEAFESIVRTYQRRVYAVTLRMTRQHHVADDITQETFVRAYTQLHRFEIGRPLAPWLTRIAVNLSINYLTGRVKREQPLEDDTPVDRLKTADEKSPDPLNSLLSSEFAHALARAVEKLPPEQKAVFILRVHEEMRYEEIADSLGISSGTVMSRLHRARSKLKEMMRDYL
jgi:RNA polymerase sigma-70 factor (ECF subfamily)